MQARKTMAWGDLVQQMSGTYNTLPFITCAQRGCSTSTGATTRGVLQYGRGLQGGSHVGRGSYH